MRQKKYKSSINNNSGSLLDRLMRSIPSILLITLVLMIVLAFYIAWRQASDPSPGENQMIRRDEQETIIFEEDEEPEPVEEDSEESESE